MFTKLIINIMYCTTPYTNGSQFFKTVSALYLDFARERVERGFLISDVSAENLTFCRVTLVNDQLVTQFFYFIICLLQSSTCFEQRMLIIRRSNCINTASGIVTLCKWPSGEPDGHLQRVTIPDAVLIQFDFLIWARRCSKHAEDCNKRIIK